MNLQKITTYAENKTKILIISSIKQIENLVIHIIEFLGHTIDFVSTDRNELNDNDFIILFSNNIEEDALVFQPNIVLLTDVLPNTENLISSIVSGGILVYPNHAIVLETQLLKTDNFFRKIPFEKTSFVENAGTYQIDTILGEVPLMTKNTQLINTLEGVRLLCQQLGIMEEEFYEAVMNYED